MNHNLWSAPPPPSKRVHGTCATCGRFIYLHRAVRHMDKHADLAREVVDPNGKPQFVWAA